MTPRQLSYYKAIRSFIEAKKRSPTYAEIGQMMGVTSSCTVWKQVKTLVQKGYLTQEHNTPGSLAIVPEKVHGMNSCGKGHPPIWYIAPACPLCDALERVRVLRGAVPVS